MNNNKSNFTLKDIEIDTKEMGKALLNIENKVRANLFTWNGQFSPQFIESLLDYYANKDSIVYDPFLGSGTTLCECARKNLQAKGIELNPSAYYMAKVYELCNLDLVMRNNIIFEIDGIIKNIIDHKEILDIIKNNILNSENEDIKNTLSLLVITMDIYKNEMTTDLLNSKWHKLKNIICDLPFSTNKISAFIGDARHSRVGDDSVNLVITSPPYINVFNYHQNYRSSVESLGFDILNIAKKEFGSNRKHRGNRFLTVIQYCIDMALSMRDIIRVCKEGSRMIFVVGRESNVLSLSFCNSELIYKIGCEIFNLNFILRQQRVFKNKFGKMIYEDILHFVNNKILYNSLEVNDIIDIARSIAKEALEEKISLISKDYKNYELILSAIENINNVHQSEEEND